MDHIIEEINCKRANFVVYVKMVLRKRAFIRAKSFLPSVKSLGIAFGYVIDIQTNIQRNTMKSEPIIVQFIVQILIICTNTEK